MGSRVLAVAEVSGKINDTHSTALDFCLLFALHTLAIMMMTARFELLIVPTVTLIHYHATHECRTRIRPLVKIRYSMLALPLSSEIGHKLQRAIQSKTQTFTLKRSDKLAKEDNTSCPTPACKGRRCHVSNFFNQQGPPANVGLTTR
jgi:hypothetical protein